MTACGCDGGRVQGVGVRAKGCEASATCPEGACALAQEKFGCPNCQGIFLKATAERIGFLDASGRPVLDAAHDAGGSAAAAALPANKRQKTGKGTVPHRGSLPNRFKTAPIPQGGEHRVMCLSCRSEMPVRVCVCVCARACVRVCVRACPRACIHVST